MKVVSDDRQSGGQVAISSSVGHTATPRTSRVRAAFAKRFGGLWVLAVIILFFSIATPDTFLTSLTLTTTLGDVAIIGLLALGIMLPLVTGMFDLSLAAIAGWAMVTASQLNVESGMGTHGVCAIALAGSLAFGIVSAFFVTRLRVNSLIATLGVGTVALGLTQLVADGDTITPNFSSGFEQFGRGELIGLPLPFVYVLVAAVIMYYILEHTPLGRRLQATGGNPDAARLAGVRVVRLQVGALLAASLLGGFTGLVLATKVGVATDTTAQGYLLPAAAAVFLGATQIREGANPWGTVLATVMLGTGIKGLQLMGADPWVAQFFNGTVLLIAVGISGKGLTRLH